MYSSYQLARKYIRYWWHASNGKGHGVHSPFVYRFIEQVLRGRQHAAIAHDIEVRRQLLLHDNRMLQVLDLGAGSRVDGRTAERPVAQIASRALKPRKYAQLLHRMASFYQAVHIVELGTSLGITTSYLASANSQCKVATFEGVPDIASVARENFDALGLNQIQQVLGNFDETFPKYLAHSIEPIDLLYIDGNHRKEPTLRYFELALPHLQPNSLVVFDDIHWSVEMEQAWRQVQQHPAVTLTIDLFFIGIACISPDFKVKQHFSIRY